MKKSLLILTLITISLNSFATGEMNIGLTMGGTGNYSKYSGGMTDASALFTNNIFASGWIGVEFRKMFSEHWSFKTGFNFSEFGFSYLLAKDYNLLKSEDQFIELDGDILGFRMKTEGRKPKHKFASEDLIGSVPLGEGPYTNNRVREVMRSRLLAKREKNR